jgi:hypothetical protein
VLRPTPVGAAPIRVARSPGFSPAGINPAARLALTLAAPRSLVPPGRTAAATG